MRNFLRKLFGGGGGSNSNITKYDEESEGLFIAGSNTDVDQYFEILNNFQEAISNRNFDLAAKLTVKSLNKIPSFIKDQLEDGLHINLSIPTLERGGTILALLGMEAELAKMKDLAHSINELERWIPIVENHLEDLNLYSRIVKVIDEKENCQQTEIKKLVGENDGRKVANLISWLEKAGKIVRVKNGRTFTLTLPYENNTLMSTQKTDIKSHRVNKKIPKYHELCIDNAKYIPLPRSPHRWDDLKKGKAPKSYRDAEDWFEIRDTNHWDLSSVNKIPINEKPDPAFRQIYPIDSGVIMIDDLGKSDLCENLPVAVIRFGREGNKITEKPLYHDIYRIGANSFGKGFIAMSRECIAHAYDDSLNMILETSLRDSPEVCALIKRLEIEDDKLKNHLRCIALSIDNARYLFTGVDEAWCIDLNGRSLWGVKLPISEGWAKVTDSREIVGSSDDVMNALKTMEMALPFTAEEFKLRYRELAKKWHPDRNPNDRNAEIKMQKLNGAAEILTGIDSQSLPYYTGASFMKEYAKETFHAGGMEYTISMEIEVGEARAADWIYAASFAGNNNSVYLAGYSGRIFHLNSDGQQLRTFNIGAIPINIIDTNDYLYFLTSTRLYVLHGDALVALIDILDEGKLLMGQTGFGLLQKKRFQWFNEVGKQIGTVVTKNPIRRVYYTPQGLVVETRQRRAIIIGVNTWWD